MGANFFSHAWSIPGIQNTNEYIYEAGHGNAQTLLNNPGDDILGKPVIRKAGMGLSIGDHQIQQIVNIVFEKNKNQH